MALLRYTLLRVLLFLVVAALLWIVGLRGLWLVMFAILGSGMISVFALSRSRDAASVSLSNWLSKFKRRIDQRAAAEDAWDEQQRAIDGEVSSSGGQRRRANGDRGYQSAMTEDRRTWQSATPGEDPRERDEELTAPSTLDELEAVEGTAERGQPEGVGGEGLGTSSDRAPGRDLPDLDDADEVIRFRDEA